mgnify:CR=1 FL=1
MKPYYEDDLVRLFHGDCREIVAWLTADVLVTDPPYGVSMGTLRRNRNKAAITGEVWTGHASDREVPREHVQVRDDALALWGDKPALVFGSWRAPKPDRTRMRLIWDKGYLFPGGVHPFRPCDEEIYVCGAWPNPKNRKGSNVPGIIRVKGLRGAKRPDHPTPKPVGLMELLIAKCPAGVIADPFAGSGATLIAAKLQGRRCIGVEVELRYCRLIAARLAQDALPFGAVS